MVIYNFESVFNIERRMHKIDPSRGGDQGLNQIVPLGGVPIRGITYVSVIILVVLILWRLPLSGSVIGVFPWYFHLFLAMMIAKLMMRYEPDGRGAHLFLMAVAIHVYWRLREYQRPVNLGGKVRVGWDGSDTQLHRAQIKGPAVVTFRLPVEDNDRWNGWHAEGGRGEPQAIAVRADQTLKVRP
jgi:hypothetical protein